MTQLRKLGLLLAGTLVAVAATASAQEATTTQVNEHADVWSVVEQQWNAQEDGDKRWIDRLLTDDFSGWGKSSPAPRGKASTKMWNRFNEQVSQMVQHELYPLSITVNGDVGIVHYLYTTAVEDKDGKIETSNGRYTDILLRTDDGWKFVAWHGGDD